MYVKIQRWCEILAPLFLGAAIIHGVILVLLGFIWAWTEVAVGGLAKSIFISGCATLGLTSGCFVMYWLLELEREKK